MSALAQQYADRTALNEKRAALHAMAFADGFPVHRRKRGWTLREAAEAIGVGHVTLHEVETGRKLPSPDSLYCLCHTYKLNFYDMVCEMGAVRAGNEARRAGLLR